MSATQTAPVPVKKPWSMPVPRYPTVTWRNGDQSGPECHGMVTKVYAGMIDVMIFPGNLHLPQPKTGVKHVSDPSLKTMSVHNPEGLWDFCEGDKLLLALEARVLALETRLAVIDGREDQD